MKNYRLEGLTRHAEEIIHQLKEEGLMGAEIEIVGALLYTKFKGEDQKMENLLANTRKVLEDAEAFLETLRNKTE